MQYGATNASISVITGAIGTGKTLLCRTFLKKYHNEFATAYIFNPLQSEHDFLRNIYQDLGGEDLRQRSIGQWYSAINHLVLKHAKQGKRSVIVVDEAHRLAIRSLEVLRLLTNLETEQRKLLTIILVGQRELDAKLEDTALFALKQRISVRLDLKPLSRKETIHYVQHRLSVAGAQYQLFSPMSLNVLAYLSKGVPRIINKVSERALLAIFIKEVFQANSRDIVRSYFETRQAR